MMAGKARVRISWNRACNMLAGLALVFMLAAAAGCGGGSGPAADPPGDPPVASLLTNDPPIVPIIGTVADGRGPITNAIKGPSSGSGDSRSVTNNGITISILQGSETSPPPGYVRIEQDSGAVSYTGT